MIDKFKIAKEELIIKLEDGDIIKIYRPSNLVIDIKSKDGKAVSAKLTIDATATEEGHLLLIGEGDLV